MRIVHVQQGLLHARDQVQLAQRCDVAIHAEQAVGGEHGRAIWRLPQLAQCAFGIGMRIAAQPAAGQA